MVCPAPLVAQDDRGDAESSGAEVSVTNRGTEGKVPRSLPVSSWLQPCLPEGFGRQCHSSAEFTSICCLRPAELLTRPTPACPLPEPKPLAGSPPAPPWS